MTGEEWAAVILCSGVAGSMLLFMLAVVLLVWDHVRGETVDEEG